MPVADRIGVPCRKRDELFIDSGNGAVLTNDRQLDQAARKIIAALAIFCLLIRIEIVASDYVDRLFQQCQISQSILILVIRCQRVVGSPLIEQLGGGRVRQNMLDLKAGRRC